VIPDRPFWEFIEIFPVEHVFVFVVMQRYSLFDIWVFWVE
jgi:hypothetical protein